MRPRPALTAALTVALLALTSAASAQQPAGAQPGAPTSTQPPPDSAAAQNPQAASPTRPLDCQRFPGDCTAAPATGGGATSPGLPTQSK